ncbi:MAG TPA: FAD-dependent oxidoreductase [Acidimicrobiales bacterium]|nr:FAD-dependent oxidoreductase [Acidimicrobiales bacterium]
MKTEWDVIVIGAGLAGLSAGATAAAGGADTVVLDTHPAGGRARTVAKGPYVFNMGAHALYLGGPGTKVLRSLGIEPDGAPSPFPRYKLLKDGGLHLMPSGPASIMRTKAMGAAAKAQFARLMGLLPAIRAHKLGGVTVDDWIADHNLRPDAEAVVRALIRLSTYTADTTEASADAVIRQLQIGARPGVVYLHGGWAQLIEGLARKVQVRTGYQATAVEPGARDVTVHTKDGVLHARRVVLAPGSPTATRALLPEDPGWSDLGRPVTAACLDLGVTRVPDPGYALSADEPLLAVTMSPPARQAPPGRAVVAALRYGATEADADRLSLDGHVARIGVRASDIEASRFLARMVVAASTPRASEGGLAGRPRVTDSGQANVYIAGDWVGPEGLLADASIASGHEAARQAVANLERAPALVA